MDLKLDRIHQIAVSANDLEVSRDFYLNTLGARLVAEFHPPGLVFFDFNGVRLLLEKGAMTGIVYFLVEDIDAAVAELQRRGVSFDHLPERIFLDREGVFGTSGDEEVMAFFKDPAGNTLALASRRPPVSQ